MAGHIRIYIARNQLSDGSETFDVVMSGVRFAAVSFKDAEALAVKLGNAISAHTATEVSYDGTIY